jgi:hypothetical protein
MRNDIARQGELERGGSPVNFEEAQYCQQLFVEAATRLCGATTASDVVEAMSDIARHLRNMPNVRYHFRLETLRRTYETRSLVIVDRTVTVLSCDTCRYQKFGLFLPAECGITCCAPDFPKWESR